MATKKKATKKTTKKRSAKKTAKKTGKQSEKGEQTEPKKKICERPYVDYAGNDVIDGADELFTGLFRFSLGVIKSTIYIVSFAFDGLTELFDNQKNQKKEKKNK